MHTLIEGKNGKKKIEVEIKIVGCDRGKSPYEK